MLHEAIEPITWDEAVQLLTSGSSVDQARALIRCGYFGVEPQATIDACRSRLGPDQPRELRDAAILCLTHLVRRTSISPPQSVLDLVDAAGRDDPQLARRVHDFWDDVEFFTHKPV